MHCPSSKRVFLILCAVVSFARGYDPSLAPDRAADALVYRLVSRYGLKPPRSILSQPRRAAELAAFLERADSLDAAGVLTGQESLRLERLKRIVSGERALLSWPEEERLIENHLNLSLLGEIDLFREYEGDFSAELKGIIAPSLSGAIGRVSYFSEIDVFTEYLSDSMYQASGYQPYEGVPYNLYGRADSSHTRSSDIFRGGLSFSGRHVDFETAVDYLRQGPAVYYPLTFSGEAPPVTYFRARMDLAGPQYVHTFGLLRSQKNKDKHFYAHRLTIPALNNRLNIGISEVVVTGSTTDEQDSLDPVNRVQDRYRIDERDWEWVYMIPFVPYAFAEHYVGDRDNVVLSFDVSLTMPRCFRWYLEFFLDDITTPLTIFSNDWGNKWAVTAGGQYYGVWKERDVTATIEYSRVEPWVYTHFGGGSHRYTHFGQSIGSPLGPNADGLVGHLTYAIHRLHTVGLLARIERKNEQVRGGSLRHIWQEGKDSEIKVFLESEGREVRKLGGVTWQMSPFGLFHVEALAFCEEGVGLGFEASGGFSF
ncbi:MAG: hypothetical protein GF344_16430 [Chitinivibrionales bacterium]|nr:hypothetical protein [Chitinivibrionales bacterium]MBD3358283.1 hypothetical protein [Chitinivibrionales bacterium]